MKPIRCMGNPAIGLITISALSLGTLLPASATNYHVTDPTGPNVTDPTGPNVTDPSGPDVTGGHEHGKEHGHGHGKEHGHGKAPKYVSQHEAKAARELGDKLAKAYNSCKGGNCGEYQKTLKDCQKFLSRKETKFYKSDRNDRMW